MIAFEWSSAKARANLKKHGVSFADAQSVFYDEYARQLFDEARPDKAERFIMLGTSPQPQQQPPPSSVLPGVASNPNLATSS